jgi:hypothetical protein
MRAAEARHARERVEGKPVGGDTWPEERESVSSEKAQDGTDAAEDPRSWFFVGTAEPEELLQCPPVPPVVADEPEAVELQLAHETVMHEPVPDRVVAGPEPELVGKLNACGKPFQRYGTFHWYLRFQ